MRIAEKGIHSEWNFVIGGGAEDRKTFFNELEKELQPQIEALKVRSGYLRAGSLLSKNQTHFMKFGSYYSLTSAEPFGRDLKVNWYLYSTKDGALGRGSVKETILTITDFLTGKTRDKVTAFGVIGKDSAERVCQAVLQRREEPEKETSGKLGDL